MKPATLIRRSALVLTLGLATSWNALAQMAPGGKLLTFIVPQPAGNPTDGMARKMQAMLQQELRQSVVVDNSPGAGGSIGVNKVLKAPAGAPALLIATQTEPILTPLALTGVRYRPEDLRAVALVARGAYVLVGRPDLPAKNLAELASLARQPGSRPLSHGHIGTGSMIHLLGEQWARKENLTLTQVPYKGVPPVAQDVMSGQIDLAFLPMGGNILSLIGSGKVRAYGITAAAAAPQLPDVPPMSQQNKALAGFVYGTWAAVFVPRITPEPEVNRLHRALTVALKDPGLHSYIAGAGSDTVEPMSMEQLEDFYRSETRLYQGLAREIGLKAE